MALVVDEAAPVVDEVEAPVAAEPGLGQLDLVDEVESESP